MANSYFPMLPKVNEDVSKILKDQAGIWKDADINFLQGLANSLDCGESIKDMGSVGTLRFGADETICHGLARKSSRGVAGTAGDARAERNQTARPQSGASQSA